MATLAHPAISPIRSVDDAIGRLIRRLTGMDDSAGAFLRQPDGSVADTKSWRVWDWPQGVGLYGIARHVDATGDAQALAEIERWFAARLAEPEPRRNINTMAPVLTLAWLAERTRDPALLERLGSWGDWAMRDLPRTEEGGFQHVVIDRPNTGQLWDDTLMMTVLPLARAGLLLDRPDWVEEAKRQFLVHARFLTDTATGLWFHGWTFEGRHNFARALWARGNSWITMAIPDFLELLNLPAHDATRLFLTEVLAAQVAALARTQRADGLWPTILDDPDSYGEASATAGFAYGICKGVRSGLLDRRLLDTGRRAAEAILANVRPSGELANVSFGTPMFGHLSEYKTVALTEMPYGQAMAVLALGEHRLLLQAEDVL